ncbi:MAG: CbiX/SirB N-terminal domain-containing protein [Planctomycetaceae bacterium]
MHTENQNLTSSSRTAALLIAHGSRKPKANADLVELAERVRAHAELDIVEIAYLELAAPSIPEGLNACLKQNAARILMMPYFLSAGSHVEEDLGRYRDEFQAEHPEIEIAVCPPLGLHSLMEEIVLDRIREGMERLHSDGES